jgi:hypothetical protein
MGAVLASFPKRIAMLFLCMFMRTIGTDAAVAMKRDKDER